MNIIRTTIKDVSVFQVQEDIRAQNPQELYSYVFNHIEDASRDIALDLLKVTYINSFALGILIKLHQDLEAHSHKFFLWNVQPEVYSLLKVTKVLDRFRIITAIDDIPAYKK